MSSQDSIIQGTNGLANDYAGEQDAPSSSSGSYRGRSLSLQTTSELRDAEMQIAEDYGSDELDDINDFEYRTKELRSFKNQQMKAAATGTGDEDLQQLAVEASQDLPDFDEDGRAQKFFQELLEILQGAAGANEEVDDKTLFDLTKEHFDDPSYRYGALKFAEEALRGRNADPSQIRRLAEARDNYMASDRQNIQAGLNTMRVTPEFTRQGMGSPSTMADFYRERILGNEKPRDTFNAVMRQYGKERFEPTIQFLIKALGADLQASESSISPEKLRSLIEDIYQLEVLGNIKRFLDVAVTSTNKSYQVEIPYDSFDLLNEAFNLIDSDWPDVGTLTNLLDRSGLSETEARIYLMNNLAKYLRLIPLKFFKDPSSRDGFMGVIQQALDIESEREDEEDSV